MERDQEMAIQTGTTAATGGTLNSVQHLRAIAAYLVVAFHLTDSLARETGAGVVFTLGAVGVDMFFVLSGFVMAMVVDRSEAVDGSFLMTGLLFAVALVAPGLLNTAKADLGHLVSSLLLLPHDDGHGAATPILALGWTLNYEMFFYALIAVTTHLFTDRRLYGVIAAIFALVLLGRVVPGDNLLFRFYTDPIMVEFAIGIMIYHLAWRHRAPGGAWIYGAALATGIVMLMCQTSIGEGQVRLLTWGIPASLVVAGGIRGFDVPIPTLKKLGDWSYSTYLLHIYVIQLVAKLILPHVGISVPSVLAIAVLIFPVIAAGSWALFTFVEMPAMRAILRRHEMRSAAIAAAE
jgi:peptidoglycan/LPS O-acetylase OafA/YrhL